MRVAQQQRQVGETNMNKSSSRSHCIFTLKVHAKKKVPGGNSILEVNGKLHCVDLAGSECAKSANLDKNSTTDLDQAARERERLNINRSLLTLGRVVSMLKEQSSSSSSGGSGGSTKKNVRIPYRYVEYCILVCSRWFGRLVVSISATN